MLRIAADSVEQMMMNVQFVARGNECLLDVEE